MYGESPIASFKSTQHIPTDINGQKTSWQTKLKQKGVKENVFIYHSILNNFNNMPYTSVKSDYLMGPYNAGHNLTPAPLTPALITPVSNCAEYKKVFISAFNGNIRQKIS